MVLLSDDWGCGILGPSCGGGGTYGLPKPVAVLTYDTKADAAFGKYRDVIGDLGANGC